MPCLCAISSSYGQNYISIDASALPIGPISSIRTKLGNLNNVGSTRCVNLNGKNALLFDGVSSLKSDVFNWQTHNNLSIYIVFHNLDTNVNSTILDLSSFYENLGKFRMSFNNRAYYLHSVADQFTSVAYESNKKICMAIVYNKNLNTTTVKQSRVNNVIENVILTEFRDVYPMLINSINIGVNENIPTILYKGFLFEIRIYTLAHTIFEMNDTITLLSNKWL
jgi:hypothetical protein